MLTGEFLSRILPAHGFYCGAVPAETGYRQSFTMDQTWLAKRLVSISEAGHNAYYAMASFSEKLHTGGRKHDNVQALKSFWLDIDCGAAKAEKGQGYATKREAVIALRAALQTLHLPEPMVVDSGNGLHCYWPLTQEMDRTAWRIVAFKLVAVLKHLHFLSDYACSADCSRVLRPVGTQNWKDPANPKPVKLLVTCPDYDGEALDAALDRYIEAHQISVAAPRTADAPVVGPNADLMLPYEPTSVADLVANKCAQVAQVRDTRGDVPYEQWRGTLGLIKHCVDGIERAVQWTERRGATGHGVTDVTTTYNNWGGSAPTCALFDRANPGVCDGCAYKGQITSPIQLGEPEPVVQVEAAPVIAAAEVAAVLAAPSVLDDEPMPELPPEIAKLFRWNKGFMQTQVKAPDGEWVYRNFTESFIVVEQVTRAGPGHVLQLLVWRPTKRHVRIELPAELIHDKQGLLKALARQGVGPLTGRTDQMINYMSMWFDEARQRVKEMGQYQHFGWQDDNSFLIGDRLYKDGEVTTVSLGGDAARLAGLFKITGSLDAWKQVVARAYTGEGLEQYQFMLACGFGAPLMRFNPNYQGLVIDSVSPGSGFGKTQAALAMLGIFGNPSKTMISYAQTTINALYARIGVMHSLPVYVDEITDAKAGPLGEFAYSVSIGRPKERVGRDGALKEAKASWNTMVCTSGNASIYARLGVSKENAEAQLVRVFEFRAEKNFVVPKDESESLFSLLHDNYGAAGDLYMRYVTSHHDEICATLRLVQAKIDKAAGIKTSERFWSAGASVAITGAMIAVSLGLVRFDVKVLTKWVVNQIIAARTDVHVNVHAPLETFGVMMNDLSAGVIGTDSWGDVRGRAVNVTRSPMSRSLTGRTVSGEGKVWVSRAAMQRWCNDNNADYKELLRALKEAGLVVGEESRSLGAGTDIASARGQCIVFDQAVMGGELPQPPHL